MNRLIQMFPESQREKKPDTIKRALALIFAVCLLLSIVIVCLLGPAIDAMGEWLNAKIVRQIHVGLTALGGIAVLFIWWRFKK